MDYSRLLVAQVGWLGRHVDIYLVITYIHQINQLGKLSQSLYAMMTAPSSWLLITGKPKNLIIN